MLRAESLRLAMPGSLHAYSTSCEWLTVAPNRSGGVAQHDGLELFKVAAASMQKTEILKRNHPEGKFKHSTGQGDDDLTTQKMKNERLKAP